MPWTAADVDKLKTAIANGQGARSITFSDHTVTFHTVDEMLKLLAVMQAEASPTTNPRTRYAATSKGF